MKVYAYGEDALTLWAIKNRLSEILSKLGDETKVDECKIFFRPSFGRGGKGTSNFGEFDFIILAKEKLYLGESKWDGSSIKFEDKSKKKIKLDEPQALRHKIFQWYVENWDAAIESTPDCWEKFYNKKTILNGEKKIPKVQGGKKKKVLPLLAQNLIAVLDIINKHFSNKGPEIVNVLLYMHKGEELKEDSGPNDFKVVNINYTYAHALKDNLIEIEL